MNEQLDEKNIPKPNHLLLYVRLYKAPTSIERQTELKLCRFRSRKYKSSLILINPEMELQYMGGAIVALLVLGCGFSLRMSGRKRRSKGGSIGFQKHGNGEGHRDVAARNDVVIVGAGVVGSALAFALGKVNFLTKDKRKNSK